MRISFSPQRRDGVLALSKAGEELNVNGSLLDFSGLPDGATLPTEAIASEWIAGPVERVDGELQVTLLLPHGPDPAPEIAFAAPITVTADGPVALPVHPYLVNEEE